MKAKAGQDTGAAESVKKPRAKTISQSAFPFYSLEKSLKIPKAIVDEFGGRGGDPNHIALAIDWTPTGGAWRTLTGSSIAYGLTEGGYAASEIKLTARGSAIVAPTEEGAEKSAFREALLAPTIMRAFVEKYDNQKFPSREIGINVLAQLGLPRERCGDAYDLIEENLRYVGALQQVKTGYMVLLSMIDAGGLGSRGVIDNTDRPPDETAQHEIPSMPKPASNGAGSAFAPAGHTFQTPPTTNVFISHGKNRELIEHLKKLVTFVKLTPVVSVEITDTSKPVPQKVLEEMRSCFGGIIHIRSEGEWTDGDGKTRTKINDNVLIEIGAAMAIYKDNFILLVEKGVTLPSNLQGLFVCHYEGDRMDGDATMRLLEGLNKFKPT